MDDNPLLPDSFLVTRSGGAGITAGQARARRFLVPSRGIRIRADADDPARALAEAVLTSATSPTVLADLTAAELWSLPLPHWATADGRPVSAAVTTDNGRQQRRGVRGRRLRLPADHVTRHRGLSVTTPARTWLDCAEHLPLADLVVIGDVILRRHLADEEDLARLVRWGRGRRGVATARRALPLLDPAAESPGESRTRVALLIGGLPRPLCNVDIVDNGEWLARADLAYLDEKIIIEYDGRVHEDEQQRRRDALRRNLLQQRGWLVIVFTADDLRRPERMASLVRSALDSRRAVTRRARQAR